MPIGTGIIYNAGDLILGTVSGSGTAFLETKIAAATSSIVYFDSNARINSASLNSITVGTASYVSGSTSIITNLTASNISASGTSSFGYVGIGTNSPNDLLQLQASSATAYDETSDNGQYGSGAGITITNMDLTAQSFAQVNLQVSGNAGRALGRIVAIRTASATSDLAFVTENANTKAEKMRILSDGNLGIGTTAPGAKLEISSSTAASLLNVKGAGGNGLLFVSGSGIVGIGTASPANSKLHIYADHINGHSVLKIQTITSIATSGTPSLGFFDSDGTRNTLLYAASDGTNLANEVSKPIIFSTNSTERMRIDSGGAVGIGTSTVSRILHAYVTTGPVMRVQSSGSNASIEFIPSIGHNRYNWLIGAQQNISDAFEITPSTATNGTTFTTPAILVASSGNIGIGTTSPTQRLDLSGSLRIRSAGTYSDPADNAGFINYDSTGGIFTLSARSNGGNTYMAFRTSNAGTAGEKMRIINDGNVGIGTTSPAAKLDISGSATTIALSFGITVPNNPLFINTYNSNTGIGMDQATAGLRLAGDSGGGSNPLVDIGYYSGGTVSHANWISRLKVLNNGNVGIGTTSPVTQLHVSGSLQIGNGTNFGNKFTLYDDFSSGKLAYVMRDLNGDDLFGLYCNSTTGEVRFLADDDNANTAFMTFQMNASERMRITNDGNVGIGTTSVGSPLEVYGTSMDPSLTPSATSIFNVNSLGVELAIGRMVTSPFSIWLQGKHATVTGSLTYPIVLNPLGGFVGIGTTSPSNRLEVAGSTFNRVTFKATSNVQTGIQIIRTGGVSNTDWEIYSPPSSGDLRIYNGSDYVTFQSGSGNVGIGVTSPGYKLEMYGTSTAIRILSTTGDAYVRLTDNGVRNWDLKVVDVNDYFEIGGTNATSLVVTGAGNVGIGTTSPTAKFQVGTHSIGDASNGDNSVIARIGGSNAAGRVYNLTLANTAVATLSNESALSFVLAGNYSATSVISAVLRSTVNAATDLVFTNYNGSLQERMRILYDGNVGIGTTNPVGKLDVRAGSGGEIIFGSYDANYVVKIQSGDQLNFYNGASAGAGYINYGGGATVLSQNLHVEKATGGTTGLVRINSNGNVGIGTTSPATKLYISGSSSTNENLPTTYIRHSFSGTIGYGLSISRNGSDTAALCLGVDSSLNAIISSNNADLRIGKTQSSTFNEYIRVNTSGNVGIGTTSPSIKLAVDGEASFGDGSKLTLIGLDINSGDSPNFIKIRTKIPFASGAADFTINIKGFRYNSAETTNLSICWHYYSSIFYNPAISSAGSFAPIVKLSAEDWDSSGIPKVCIVLVGPGYWPKLYVESMYSSNYNDTYADGWDWVDADATGTGNNLAILSYKSNFGNSFVMLNNGNVGIGTTSVGSPLEVYGTSMDPSLTPSATSIFNVNSLGVELAIGRMVTSPFSLWLQGKHATVTGSLTYPIVLNPLGGFVGIGTTSPSLKLDVRGDFNIGGGSEGIRLGNVGDDAAYDNVKLYYTGYNSGNPRIYLTPRTQPGSGAVNTYLHLLSNTAGGPGANNIGLLVDGNVGIGTTNPTYKLQIGTVGSLADSIRIGTYQVAKNTRQYIGYSRDDSGLFESSGQGDTPSTVLGGVSGIRIVNTEGTLYAPQADNSVQILTHIYNGGSKIALHAHYNGNVGIGTTGPSARLHVFDTNSSPATGNLLVTSTGGNASIRIDSNSTANYTYFTLSQGGVGKFELGIVPTSSDLYINPTVQSGPTGAAIYIKKADGNVGIGTTSPNTLLNVNGANPFVRINNTVATDHGIKISYGNSDTHGLHLLYNPNSAISYIDNTYPVASSQTYGDIYFRQNVAGTMTTRMTIKADVGFVGIGTTSPTNTLSLGDVGSIGQDINTMYVGSNFTGVGVNYRKTGNFALRQHFDSALGIIRFDNAVIGTSGNAISFNERMRIDSSGNVGIGTTTGTFTLNVYNNADVWHARFGGATGEVRIGGQTSSGAVIQSFVPGSGTVRDLYLQRDGGNVGIGTTSPAAKLQTYATNTGSQFLMSAQDGVNSLNFGLGFSVNSQTFATIAGYYTNSGGSGAGDLTFYTKTTSTSLSEKMRIQADGNVGIGTTSPAYLLHVNSTGFETVAKFRGGNDTTIIIGGSDAGGSGEQYITYQNTTTAASAWMVGMDDGEDFRFAYGVAGEIDDSKTKVKIGQDGNVGIGTAAPAAKLEISGSSNSALLNIKSPISGAILFVSGSGAVGINTSTVGAYTLQVNGSFAATTKSFIIDHPTKAGKKLIYGSLESPYHGIRLTGRDTLKEGKCKVELPDYIYKLILHDSVNIQLTGIKCNKTLYVDEINIPENYFTIAYDNAIFESYKDYDFFWDFTGIRTDVPELITEL